MLQGINILGGFRLRVFHSSGKIGEGFIFCKPLASKSKILSLWAKNKNNHAK